MKDQRQLQQRIRQDAEEKNNALIDLSSWMDTFLARPHPAQPQRSQTSAVSSEQWNTSEAGGTYEEMRSRGNDYFAQKQYPKALDCYTRCLETNESLKTPVIFANRAMTYLKLKKYAMAESDASKALEICPTHAKSLHRRSVARLSLGNLRGALLDAYAAESSCDAGDVLKNVEIQKSKCENALVTAVERAPRRNVKITVV